MLTEVSRVLASNSYAIVETIQRKKNLKRNIQFSHCGNGSSHGNSRHYPRPFDLNHQRIYNHCGEDIIKNHYGNHCGKP